MSEPHSSIASASDALPLELVEVGHYATAQEGFQHSLVVLAMGSLCWLAPDDTGGFRLLVEAPVAANCRVQLACFDRESLDWPPVAPRALPRKPDLITPLLWALTVVLVFWGQAMWPRWTQIGAVDASAIFHEHEWWRLGAALFLHSDVDHLVSNGLGGILVFAAVLSTFGRIKGWLLIGISAVAGNLAVAAINHPAPYRSLGASTAIFAALGLLTGHTIRILAGADRRRRWRAMLVPLAAGLTVLGLYGAGGIHVDVMAHVTGFGAGLLFGLCANPELAVSDR